MPTTSRQRRETSASPEPSLEGLREQLALLRHEQDELPAAVEDAMAATDVERWMALTVRQRDLPGLINQARLALIPAEVDAAWEAIRPVRAAEAAARRRERTAQRAVDDLNTSEQVHRIRTFPEQAAYATEQYAARKELAETQQALRQAQHATSSALAAVDALEDEHLELTGKPLPVTSDRPGPRRLIATTMRGRTDYLDDGETAPESLPFSDTTSGAFTLHAGTVLPRWHAHLLGEHLFAPMEVTA